MTEAGASVGLAHLTLLHQQLPNKWRSIIIENHTSQSNHFPNVFFKMKALSFELNLGPFNRTNASLASKPTILNLVRKIAV